MKIRVENIVLSSRNTFLELSTFTYALLIIFRIFDSVICICNKYTVRCLTPTTIIFTFFNSVKSYK